MKQSGHLSVERLLKKEVESYKDLPLAEQIEKLSINLETIPTRVIVDPTVALNIIKHARESYPRYVSGQILGYSLNGVLEITNSFYTPNNLSDAEETKYQLEMLNYMQEVNMDSNLIGWYTSTKISSFMQKSCLDIQLSYQDTPNSSSIVLLYDAERSELGSLALRAYRLSDKYLSLKEKAQLSTTTLISSKIGFKDLFTELPIYIKSQSLTKVLVKEVCSGRINSNDGTVSGDYAKIFEAKSKALLKNSYYSKKNYLCSSIKPISNGLSDTAEGINAQTNICSNLAMPGGQQTDFLNLPNFDLLSLQPLSGIEKNMELIIEGIDSYIQDSNSWMYWKRGAAKELGRRQAYVARKTLENTNRETYGQHPLPIESEKELDSMFRLQPEPDRLDTLLNISQLHDLSKKVNQTSGPGITRLYASFAVQNNAI
ncbi:hypothetical protein BB561_000246 [Smittium simulii]|uniref:MPN domain-containing protein n=1 Tax=Smittium simulii TaxID=133385 RepID=A0A2T9YZT0_9FUNG|nr:hypothetical protein BB561_000246 [Smittium simulii]